MMNINELGAGRELDALVGEKVMGLPNVRRGVEGERWMYPGDIHYQKEWEFYHDLQNKNGWFADIVPRYSTDIAEAWKVVGKLVVKGEFNLRDEPPNWRATFHVLGKDKIDGVGISAPFAICCAALKAIEAEDD